MVPELEKPRVTEIQVRMDCNGCVQKIKKALHGINGIYDLYIDFPQQKLTVIGWADPEKIIKAIRKTRKIATICSHTEQVDQPESGGEPPQEAQGPPKVSDGPPANPTPPAEAAVPPPEPPKDPPPPEPPKGPPPPEEKPSPSPNETNANQSRQKDVGEVHVIYHHQPPDYRNGPYPYGYGYTQNYGGGGQWNGFPNGHGPPPELQQPVYVTHSYNTHRPSPYVTEYEYIHPPPPRGVYSRLEQYGGDYHENTRNGNITSIFSDENPNACTIV